MNPITHSNVADRTEHYVAFSTGHQVAEERTNQRSYMAIREDKLRVQHDEVSKSGNDGNKILKGTRIYVNGYLESTTDLEVKRIVIQLGGQLVYAFRQTFLQYSDLSFRRNVASQCTHIITSRGLNSSKTHKILMKKSKHGVHVVKPEWIFDSLASGRRLPERLYAIHIHPAAKNLSLTRSI